MKSFPLTILNYLKREPIKNFNIIGFAENNTITNLKRIGNSVLLSGISDREWHYIASDNENELQLILNELDEDAKFFGGLEDWMLPIIALRGKIEWSLSVYNYFLSSNIIVPENKIEIAKLIPEDAYFIIEQSHYKQFLSVEYIKQRINNSFSAAIRFDGKLAAWGLTHDDSSLGMLHVIDEYRNKGYGYEITISLIQQCRERGKIPAAQIEENNAASKRLCEKLGFVRDKRVSWLKME